MKRTYAVVDIETTGTDLKKDRIIQFGCVLIEDGEIVSRFATDINPAQGISSQIQTLTGITPQRVRRAPYFEEVAVTIANFLADTTFVAHNIYFDYPFLSSELERCGLPPLTIAGIDTVELAQIFMPTSLSFRLQDLAEELKITHEHPHQADSDAEVTANLFLALEEKIRATPLVTLKEICRLAEHAAFQTRNHLEELFAESSETQPPLPEDLYVVNGLVLKKKAVRLFEENYYGRRAYPRSRKAKEQVYQGKLTFRREQARLMNAVFEFFHKKEEKNRIIEAATGLGKTLGYLLPLSYLATPEEPLVVSTASLLLQEQMMMQDLPLLNRLLEQPLQAVVLKGNRHYIDLARFYATLRETTKQKQTAFYQMAVLVWLTQTETGDFDELNMTSLNHPFWRNVAHQGLSTVVQNSPFYEADFLRHRKAQQKQSNIIITNHAFLAQETVRKQPELPNSPYLIIDEAHHLDRMLEKISTYRLDIVGIQKEVFRLTEEKWFEQWRDLAGNEQSVRRSLEILQDVLQELAAELPECYQELAQDVVDEEEQVVTKGEITDISVSGKQLIQKIARLYEDGCQLSEQIQTYFFQQKETFRLHQQAVWGRFTLLWEELMCQQHVFSLFFDAWEARYVHWLGSRQSLNVRDMQASLLTETAWYQRYEHILYLGGTLKIGSDRQYFAKRWGILEAPLKVIPSPYDYSQQARLFIPADGIAINEVSSEQYVSYLSTLIFQLAEQQKRPILVLFTSHDILNRVYQHVRFSLLNEGREVLAQGNGGSRERLLKRFLLSKDALLFGADSFWEGVDLPGEVLQLLLVTRLPFENPNRPLVQARNEFLRSEGINPFFQEAVPHAALRLRQALGRLVRSEEDKGVMLLLDRRFVTAKYGERLKKSLPKELPIKELPMKDIQREINEFLNSDKSSGKE